LQVSIVGHSRVEDVLLVSEGRLMTMITEKALEGASMDTKKTIMVVDDNPDIITIVKTILEGRGYTVFSASSGPELLNLLPNQKPDLIILDIMMPEMDGLEVLTRLKGKNETATIPVILLTAKVQYEDVLGGYKLGADYYITKPFTSTQLVNGINLLLGEGKS
jgi:CheY-like chemotaxis protein